MKLRMKVIQGQGLRDFLLAHPVADNSPLITDLPDKEVMSILPKKDEKCTSKVPNGQKKREVVG